MTDPRACTVHDHWVKTVKSQDSEEVTRLDGVGVNFDLLGRALDKCNILCLLDPLEVGLLHIGRHVGADVGKVRVVRDASDEGLHCVPQRLEIFNNIVAEGKCLDTAITNISLCLRRVHLEGEFVGAVEEENFEVLDFSVGKQDDILAHV